MKRSIDVGAATLLLALSSPVLAASAIAIRLDTPGPILHRGERVGRGGVHFSIYKLRTMTAGAERAGPAVTAGGDSRITRVGRFLRRTKIDELPQLLNVLKGDMSLVGPRPEHPDYVRLYDQRQRTLLTVRPGITSAASIAFHDEEDQLAAGDGENEYVTRIMPAKLDIDLVYLQHPSLAADFRILLQTALLVARRLNPRRSVPGRRAI